MGVSNAAVGSSRLRMDHALRGRKAPSFADDVRTSLWDVPKWLPSKYFYDERGSELFERICTLPEYYLTSTEAQILRGAASEIVAEASMGEDLVLVELGSGSSRKTQTLIAALLAAQGRLLYVPIDISPTILHQAAERLLAAYPTLRIVGKAMEHEQGLAALSLEQQGPKLVLFLGSSLGNYEPADSERFLREIRRHLGPQDHLLLGADLCHDPAVLEAAYDDPTGVTALFNKNLLERINRELGGRFSTESFDHLAFFSPEKVRVEMHLRSRIDQQVPIEAIGEVVRFSAGETIHTENCYKYTREQLTTLAEVCGFAQVTSWSDPPDRFSVQLLRPRGASLR